MTLLNWSSASGGKGYLNTGEKTLATTDFSLEVAVPRVTSLMGSQKSFLLASLKEKACKKCRSASRQLSTEYMKCKDGITATTQDTKCKC